MAVFKDGMIVDLSTRLTWKDYAYYILSIIFMIAFYVGIYMGLILKPLFFAICGVMVIYFIYSACTDSCSYINNLVELS